MRPAGDARLALLKAASELTTPLRSPTLRELIVRSCVGREAARRTVDNMKRSGLLVVMRTRRVDYRNRPVAEYAPVHLSADGATNELVRVFSAWMTSPGQNGPQTLGAGDGR